MAGHGECRGCGGLDELARVEDGLATAPLDPVYGCPDCADGGSMTLAVERDGSVVETSWEYNLPPDPLVSMDAWFHHLDDALTACEATDWVDPAEGCVPL